MNITREVRNARAALKGFNAARGAKYAKGDEADLADLLLALRVLTYDNPSKYGLFDEQATRAERNHSAEFMTRLNGGKP